LGDGILSVLRGVAVIPTTGIAKWPKRSRTIEEVEWFRDVAVVTNFDMRKVGSAGELRV